MDIRQLKYFIAIVEAGNITKAAQQLHMAQPPLSQQLKLLEDELEVKLLERGSRKIQLTDAGKILKHRAEQILELVESTTKELKDFNRGLQGMLSLGTVPSSGSTLLPERIYNFHDKYPKVSFQIWEGDTYRILDLLNNGVVEIGIVRTPINSESFEIIYLPNESMVAATKGNMYWDEQQSSIELTELIDKPLIVDRRFEKMITDSCEKANFEPKIICKSDDARSILLWASTGIGVAIVPKAAIGLIPSTNLKYKEISEKSLETKTAVIWVKNRYLSSTARHFLESFSEESSI
ncbi:LysR family transcriptional regulator [Clostridiaceae bacterium UIB06]|uniref:LysR family transcriptional regulator n=1 Tax=Clostridium thailandense TaxID=2794346 RepID=A0A949TU75_9CLOT|nr:LysR family transcriptional regulator [Clostridium thailandense]MBV7272468.1 LysR family transcriptional regulator [Clostridium thailandense]MCH5136992.1 LysR family transcriptional regulator [Clostridiaceae bacterium UIB06]